VMWRWRTLQSLYLQDRIALHDRTILRLSGPYLGDKLLNC
jgi:hypothetical protein